MKLIQRIHSIVVGGDERTHSMRSNTISMLIVKGLSILISLAYIPMILKNIERVEYGVLLTLTSIVHWVAMLDIGLGNGLRNSLSESLAHDDYDKAKENVSSCYAALALYVSVIVVVFICIAPLFPWQSILNAQGIHETELLHLAIIVFVSFCVQFVLNLLTSILYACQMPAFTSYILLATQIINFVAVYIMIFVFGITSILGIGVITCITPPIVLFVFSFILYKKRLARISPSFKHVHLKSVSGILSLGIKFFILQVITIVLFQANNIIIAQTVGPDAVVTYNVAYKYVGMILVVFNIINAPVWSAVTDAYVRSEYQWLKRTLKYLRKVFFGVMVFGLLMLILSPVVYKLWLGKDTLDIPFIVTALVLVYCAFEILYRIYGTFINGTGKLKMQMIITSLIAVIYIPLAVLFGKRIGLPGVLIANSIVFCLNYLWSKKQCEMIINQEARGLWNE